jgi:3',5'-cyclic AMP phosphodiesterase CpdA
MICINGYTNEHENMKMRVPSNNLEVNYFRMKKILLAGFIVLCILPVIRAQESGFPNFAPTIYPERIMLTISGDPATSRAVSWRTVYNDSISIGQLATMDPAPKLEQHNDVFQGTYKPWSEGDQTAMGHKVIFQGLEPNTKYAYRVGDGKNWSEWFQFKTSSDSAEPFSFLYLGDLQSDRTYNSRILREAYSHFPTSDFMLFTGDIVNRNQDEEWSEFFYSGGWIFGMMPSLPTPGNHEYDKPENQQRAFSKQWKQIYTMPLNGPSEKFNNRIYFIDYQGVRFISVDSPAIMENEEDGILILDWLEKTLETNPNRWSVVFTHYPVYSCSMGRDMESYRDSMRPVLEKYGVDIILQGHDHTYCRGRNLPEASSNSKNLPMYIVSVAGPKMYGLNTSFWSDRVASNTQLYQHVSFFGDTLSFKSYTVTGDLYDDFLLIKNKAGVNQFVESKDVREIEQRTEIPERQKTKYTDEEMLKYQNEFQQKK